MNTCFIECLLSFDLVQRNVFVWLIHPSFSHCSDFFILNIFGFGLFSQNSRSLWGILKGRKCFAL